MTPERRKRSVSAREGAQLVGRSERTVRRWVAQERMNWREEQRARRESIRVMHDEQGMSWAQIAEQLQIDRTTAQRLGYRARKERAAEAQAHAQAEREQDEPPLFSLDQ